MIEIMVLILWLVFGIAAGLVWQSKGGDLADGFGFGVVAGIFALIWALTTEPTDEMKRKNGKL